MVFLLLPPFLSLLFPFFPFHLIDFLFSTHSVLSHLPIFHSLPCSFSSVIYSLWLLVLSLSPFLFSFCALSPSPVLSFPSCSLTRLSFLTRSHSHQSGSFVLRGSHNPYTVFEVLQPSLLGPRWVESSFLAHREWLGLKATAVSPLLMSLTPRLQWIRGEIDLQPSSLSANCFSCSPEYWNVNSSNSHTYSREDTHAWMPVFNILGFDVILLKYFAFKINIWVWSWSNYCTFYIIIC